MSKAGLRSTTAIYLAMQFLAYHVIKRGRIPQVIMQPVLLCRIALRYRQIEVMGYQAVNVITGQRYQLSATPMLASMHAVFPLTEVDKK